MRDLVWRHGLSWTDEAVEQLINLVGGHPYLVRKALFEIARGSLTLEQFLAIADYNRAIELDSQEAIAYNNRGLIYRDLQQYDQALTDLNRAIELGLEEAIPDRDEVLRLLEGERRD